MISATAADLKQQLADAIRMLARAEIVDHSGHGSARRDSASFYINSAASARGTLTADDIVAVDLDGNLIECARTCRPSCTRIRAGRRF